MRSDLENSAIEVMKENMKYQDDAMLGIFWYDVNKQELFGVVSSIAEDAHWYDYHGWFDGNPDFDDSYMKHWTTKEIIWEVEAVIDDIGD